MKQLGIIILSVITLNACQAKRITKTQFTYPTLGNINRNITLV